MGTDVSLVEECHIQIKRKLIKVKLNEKYFLSKPLLSICMHFFVYNPIVVKILLYTD